MYVPLQRASLLEGTKRVPRSGGRKYGRFPKFHNFCLGRDPGTLKSDIVSKRHPQLICSDLRLSN